MSRRPAPRGEPSRWIREVAIPFSGDECLLWPFGKHNGGYGVVCVEGQMREVHRVVCELVHGPPPTCTHEAAHNCGQRSCANPHHLRWATVKENYDDRRKHGTDNRGERNGIAKITEADVREIRRLARAMPLQPIAERFGVTLQNVSVIALRKSWTWVE